MDEGDLKNYRVKLPRNSADFREFWVIPEISVKSASNKTIFHDKHITQYH